MSLNITFIFIAGLIIALVGVIPPGLLNMIAAKVSLKEGASSGIFFSIGVCVVVCIHALVAILFAGYLSQHQEVIEILQRVALVIFILITVYFFLLAQKQPKPNVEANIKSKKSRFFQGMLLSGLNMFPIPYHAYMAITIASFGWMTFDKISIASYVAGAAMGTFIMLYIYIFFFDRIKDKKFTSQKNMNYLIGSITGIISVVTLINIIKDL